MQNPTGFPECYQCLVSLESPSRAHGPDLCAAASAQKLELPSCPSRGVTLLCDVMGGFNNWVWNCSAAPISAVAHVESFLLLG